MTPEQQQRIDGEVALLRTAFPELEHHVDGETVWVRLPNYALPEGIYQQQTVELAFQIPAHAGQAPYGFWVRPGVTLTSGHPLNNYTPGVSTPWGNDWAQFSWSPQEPWIPKTDIRAGANMLNFARSFADRLREGT